MVEKIGSAVRGKIHTFWYGIGYVGRVLQQSLRFFSHGKPSRKIFIMQLLFTYIEALPIIVLLGMSLGSVIYVVGYPFLLNVGQASLIYELMVMVITRELGPVLVALVVTARSANAIATEIGSMVVDHEIESYISVGVDPVEHLVAPRFLGVTASVFLLNLYFSFAGLLTPSLIVQLVNPVSFNEYFIGLLQSLTIRTILVSCIKSLLFGMVISVCSTYYGFSVERASTEVPVVGIKAVGKSMLFIIIADVVVTAASYL
jgi:phospholipid/cholesterol/gamma-HCH transport system permease protein